MTNIKNIVAVAFLVLALGVFTLFTQVSNIAFGSVMPGGEYSATTTRGVAAGMKVVAANKVVTLGSVVIASSSPTSFTIWNATSTADTASTSVITFPANATPGTYTFDADLITRGLILQLPTGFAGDYVVTYRTQ